MSHRESPAGSHLRRAPPGEPWLLCKQVHVHQWVAGVHAGAQSSAANSSDRAPWLPQMELDTSCGASKAICRMKVQQETIYMQHKNTQNSLHSVFWRNPHMARK